MNSTAMNVASDIMTMGQKRRRAASTDSGLLEAQAFAARARTSPRAIDETCAISLAFQCLPIDLHRFLTDSVVGDAKNLRLLSRGA